MLRRTGRAGSRAARILDRCMATASDDRGPRRADRAPPLAERALSQRVRDVPPSGIRRFFDILATMDDVISLGVGEPDFDTPAGHRRGRRRQPHARPDALHQQLRHDRAAPGPVGAPRGPLRRPLRPCDRDPRHGRRVRGGRSRPPGDLRSGRRGHPPRAVVRRLRARRSRSPAACRSGSRPASRTTSRSIRRRSRRRSPRGRRRCSWAIRATRPGAVLPDAVQDELAAIAGAPRPARLQRRDLRPAGLRLVPPSGVLRAARHARPDDPDGRLQQGLRDDRLAGRLPVRAGRDPRGDRQGPPVRDHVGPDDRPGCGARGAPPRRAGRPADGRRVRPAPAAPRRRAQRARPAHVRAARRVLRLPGDQLGDRPDSDDVHRAAPDRGAGRGRPGQRVRGVGRGARPDVLRHRLRAARGGAPPDRPVRRADRADRRAPSAAAPGRSPPVRRGIRGSAEIRRSALGRLCETAGVGSVLIACGVVAIAVGTWRGYVVAREALGPMVHDDGDPTRRAIDATPPAARPDAGPDVRPPDGGRDRLADRRDLRAGPHRSRASSIR